MKKPSKCFYPHAFTHTQTHVYVCVLFKRRLHNCESTTGECSSTRMKKIGCLPSSAIKSKVFILLWTKSSNTLPSKNSFSEQIHKCRDRLKCSVLEYGQEEVCWEAAAPWLLGRRKFVLQSGRDRDQLGLQVSAMAKLSADWEVEVESLHTWSHSAHLLE